MPVKLSIIKLKVQYKNTQLKQERYILFCSKDPILCKKIYHLIKPLSYVQ